MNNFNFRAMSRGVIVILILLIFPFKKAAAQNTSRERLEAYKIAFFTRRLNLTSREAEKFWPVYNQYQRQKNEIQVERNAIVRNFNQNGNNLDDNQITEIGDNLISTYVRESDLAVSFHEKLKEILPPVKVIRLYQVENQYKAQLLNELQGARQQQRTTPRPDL